MKSLTSAITCLVIFFLLHSCTKTVTQTKIVTDTVTVTHTINDTVVDTVKNINLASGLVAYYPFNGNVNDSSGNGLNGTIVGGVTFANDIAGNANSAANFDGSTGYITVADNGMLTQTNAVTVSFLIKLNTTSNRQAFIANQNYSDASGLSYAVLIPFNSINMAEFGVLNDTSGCRVVTNDPNSTIFMGNLMNPGQWYHFACIFTDSLEAFYVNGTLNTAITRTFANLNKCNSKMGFVIGSWWSGD